MLYLPLLVLANLKTMSIEISVQGVEGTGRGIYKPYGFKRDLAFWHVVQQVRNRSTSHLIFGQKKCVAKTSSVFLTPKYPIKLPPCASYNNKRWTEPTGMHKWLVMRISLLCIQCKAQSLEHVRDSWIFRYVLTLLIIFQNLRLVPCMFYWLGTMERTTKDLEKAKESRRRS
jgi:hypothetical protein